MSWTSVLPEILCSAAVFVLPGLLVAYLGGLRGITAWGTAPLVTVGVVTGVGIASGIVGAPFGPVTALLGAVAAALVALAFSFVLRLRGVRRPPSDGFRYHAATGAAVLAAAVIGTVTFVLGIGKPGAISQTWDSVFHYNAIRYIVESGNGSALEVGSLNQPGTHGQFYPAAWHDMAALLAQLTGASVPVAALVTCLVISVLVWPLGCLLLCRQLFGASGSRAASAAVVTGFVASLFGPFPWMIMGWGVLWPNALGTALAVGGVALGLSVLRLAEQDRFDTGRRWFFAVIGAWAVAISHPNSAISVAVLLLPPLLIVFGRYLRAEWTGGHRTRGAVVLAAVVVVVTGGWVYVSGLATIRSVRSFFWPPFDTVPQALGETFTNGTNGQHGALLLSLFMLVGMVACFVGRTRRWLVVAELLTVALYVGSAAIGSPLVRQLTGFWYDDSHRIAATLPIVAIPLSVIGLLTAGEWIHERIPAPLAGKRGRVAGITLVAAAAVAAVSALHGVPNNAQVIGREYSTVGDYRLVGPQKRAFFHTVESIVPPGALVANDPFDGTAALWALTGTRVLFPKAGPTSDPELTYLAKHLVDAATDPRACALVREYDVDFMVTAPDNYHSAAERPGFYSGVTDPHGRAGFQLVASAGKNRLYEITTCRSGDKRETPTVRPTTNREHR